MGGLLSLSLYQEPKMSQMADLSKYLFILRKEPLFPSVKVTQHRFRL